MNIAIDFDGTIDRDPAMWKRIVEIWREFGHEVWLVTCRRGTFENKEIVAGWLEEYGFDIPFGRTVFTDLGSKVEAMEKRGVKIDIWIDDDPNCVINGK